jgi:hypothetical protein
LRSPIGGGQFCAQPGGGLGGAADDRDPVAGARNLSQQDHRQVAARRHRQLDPVATGERGNDAAVTGAPVRVAICRPDRVAIGAMLAMQPDEVIDVGRDEIGEPRLRLAGVERGDDLVERQRVERDAQIVAADGANHCGAAVR